jgi:hypothetical protein
VVSVSTRRLCARTTTVRAREDVEVAREVRLVLSESA